MSAGELDAFDLPDGPGTDWTFLHDPDVAAIYAPDPEVAMADRDERDEAAWERGRAAEPPTLRVVGEAQDPRDDPAFEPGPVDPARLHAMLDEIQVGLEPDDGGLRSSVTVSRDMSRAARDAGIDAADLLAMDLPPLRMVVPGLLPEGTTVLASPPKVGKSCLVYQVAVEVAIGGDLFGQRVAPGSALYLALEDGKRRGQQRLRAALGGRTMPRGRLEVRWSAPKIGQGLEEAIAGWLDEHPDAALVAIDTLGKVRPKGDGRRNAYDVDVDDLTRLQALFRDRPVALVIVHHTNKEQRDDFVAAVSGTYGISGSADTIVVIRRKRLEAFGSIVVGGREIAEAELPVRFDGLVWHGAPEAIPEASFERSEVYRAIERSGPIFPAAIARDLGLGRTSVQNMVGALVDRGAVQRTAKGYVATLPSLPHDSNDSLSHQSHGGVTHTRARVRPGDLTDEAAAAFEELLPEAQTPAGRQAPEPDQRSVGQ